MAITLVTSLGWVICLLLLDINFIRDNIVMPNYKICPFDTKVSNNATKHSLIDIDLMIFI